MEHTIGREFHLTSLLRFALPTMIMMIFMSLYTIVDAMFISRLIGTNALSSLNIVYPVINILIALGIMLATGASAVVAKKIGEDNLGEAKQNFTFIVLVGIVVGCLIMVLTTWLLQPICQVLGATDLLLPNCKIYLQTLIYFAPACVLQMLFQTFFVTAGKPTIGLIVTIAGGVLNAVLDYILMGPLQMGMAGAAIATGIGQLVPAIAGIVYFLAVRKGLCFVIPRIDWRVLAKSCLNGSSEMVSNLSNAVITFLFNIIMLRLLGEDGVAAITIALYGQFLFTALFLGFSMGVAPIFSYNYGSDNREQLKRIYKICRRFIFLSSVVIMAMAMLLAPAIVSVFTPEGTATYSIATKGIYLFSLNYIFAGSNIFASAMFTAFSNGIVSAVISFARTFGFIVVSILLLPQVLGVNGVWLAVPFAELATIFISTAYFRRKRSVYHYA